MSLHHDFLRYAATCELLSVDGDVVAHRATLHAMAHAWRRLAGEEERIADLVREVDGLFCAPGNAADLAFRRAWDGKDWDGKDWDGKVGDGKPAVPPG